MANKRHVQASGERPRLKPLVRAMAEGGLLGSLVLAGGLGLSQNVFAGPEGGVVISGAGSVSQVAPKVTHIDQYSQNLLMNFESFDVAADESVQILQPDITAWFVGRVVGGSPTSIFGAISANGQVALVNPRGVIFGESSTVDAAGVFASGLNVNSDTPFDGQVNFAATDNAGGSVINNGLISASTGGTVTLLGETVANNGVVRATLGHVNLAAGRKAVVSFGDEGLLGVEVTESVLRNNEGLRAAVTNSGLIEAAGGQVVLTGQVSRDLFDSAVNNSGVIRARSASYRNGVLTLGGRGGDVVNTGVLDVSSEGPGDAGSIRMQSDQGIRLEGGSELTARSSGGDGGAIVIEAETVVISQSLLDASGGAAGGTVDITGFAEVSVSQDATLQADATGAGDGGVVSITGETITFAGTASARGGQSGGDGGLVLLAASALLEFNGHVDTSAPQGKVGELHLSADSIDVGAGGLAAAALAAGVGDVTIYATQTVSVDLEGSVLDLGDNSLSVNVVGDAGGGAGLAFLQLNADDTIRTTGTITITVRDEGVNGDALIDIAGRLEAEREQPLPIPDSPPGNGNDIALVSQNGRIRLRDSARLRASDGDEGGLVLLHADGSGDSGAVVLSGAISVHGNDGAGGQVRILGDRVALVGTARVDASGSDGGLLLVGGNYQGLGDEPNAQRVHVASGVSLVADGVEVGDGGTIVVWSDDTTTFYGEISARGGAAGGDGGAVEVSGKRTLDFAGAVDTSAPLGATGLLLLDPDNILITDELAGDGTNDGEVSGDGLYEFGDLPLSPTIAEISAGTLEGLASTTNISLQAAETIVIADLSSNTKASTASQLTLQTDNTVEFLSGQFSMATTDTISIVGSGSLTINANHVSATGGDGSVSLGTILTAAGGVTVIGNTIVTEGITTGDVSSGLASGSISLTATTGAVTLNGNVETGAYSVADTGSAEAAISGDVTISAGTDVSGVGRLITGTAEITGVTDELGNDVATSGSILLTAGTGGLSGGIGLSSADAITVGIASRTDAPAADEANAGDVTLGAFGEINNNTAMARLDVEINAPSAGVADAGVIAASTAGADGDIYLTSDDNLEVGIIDTEGTAQVVQIVTTGDADLTVSGVSALDSDSLTLGGAATGAVTIAGALSAGSVVATGNSIDVQAVLNTALALAGGGVTLEADTTTLTIGAGGDIDSDGAVALNGTTGISTAGDVDTSGALITFNDATVLTGDVSLTSADGAITFASTLDGTTPATEVLDLDAGSGIVTFTGTVGAVSPGAVTIHDASDVNLARVTAASFTQVAGSGTTTIGGTLSSADVNVTNSAVGITAPIDSSGGVTLIAESGSLTSSSGGAITAVGDVTITGDDVNIAGDITTDDVVAPNVIAVTGSVRITADTGNIVFDAVITTGDATVSDSVGADEVATSGDITLNAQTDISGGGRLVVGFAALNGISEGGSDSTTSGSVEVVAGLGGVSGGIHLAATDAIVIGASQRTNASGTDTATAGDLLLSAIDAIDNGVANTPIQLEINAAQALNANQGALSITTTGISGDIAITTAKDIGVDVLDTEDFGTQAVLISGTGGATLRFLSLLDLDDDNLVAGSPTAGVTLGGALGAGSVTFGGDVTLMADVAIDTSTAGGSISFDGTLDGATANSETLTLTAGAGDISFDDVVGATSLADLIIVSANDVSASETITARSFAQTTGTGTTELDDTVTANAGNIVINNSVVTIDGGLDASSGLVSLNASGGTLTLAGPEILSNGVVSLTGVTGIEAQGDIVTIGAGITFTGATTLTGTLSAVTNIGAGDLTFTDTLNGAGDLAVDVGTGDVLFEGVVGADARLGDITIATALNVTADFALRAASFDQAVGTGITDLKAVDVTTDIGVRTNSVVLGGAIAAGGAVLIDVVTGGLTLPAITAAGALDLTAPGTLIDDGLIDVGGTATFDATSIDLSSAEIDGTISLTTTTTATLVNDAATILGASNVGTDLVITATGGGISDVGVVNVGGDATYRSSVDNANIELDQQAVAGRFEFDTAGATGDVVLQVATALDFKDASTINGSLTVTADGAIADDSGAASLQVTGTATLDSGAATITLQNAANDLAVLDLASNSSVVSVVDLNDIVLAGAAGVGSLVLNLDGQVSQTGPLVINSLSVDAGGTAAIGNAVDLGNSGNNFGTGAGGVTIVAAGNVTIREADSFDLNGVNAGGVVDVGVDADAGVEAGVLTITGDVIAAGGLVIAGDAGLDDSVVVEADLTADGGVTISSLGQLTFDATSPRMVDASAGDIDMTSVIQIEIDGGLATISIEASGDVGLGAVTDVGAGAVGASLSVHAGGSVEVDDISLDGATIDGNLSLTADSDNNSVELLTLGGTVADVSNFNVSAGLLQDGSHDDTLDISGSVTATSVSITNASVVNVAGGTVIHSTAGNLLLVNNVGSVMLVGTGDVVFDQDGDTFDFAAASISSNSDGATNNLLIEVEDAAVTLPDIDLAEIGSDGSFAITLDDNVGVQSLTINAPVDNVGGVTISGTGGNDLLDVDANIRSTAGILIQNLASMTVAGGTVHEATGGDFDLSGVTLLSIDGAADATLDLIASSPSDSDLLMPGVVVTSDQNLRLFATGTVDLNDSINLGAGDLSISVETDTDAGSEIVDLDQTLAVGNLVVAAGGPNASTILVSAPIVVSGDVSLGSAQTVDVNVDITAGGALSFSDSADVQISGGTTLIADGGDLTFSGTVAQVSLDGLSTSDAILRTATVDADIVLQSVVSTGPNLVLQATNAVSLGDAINLGTHNLTLTFDTNGNAGVQQLLNRTITAGVISVSGSGVAGTDEIELSAPLFSSGAITLGDTETIDLNENITAGTNLTIRDYGALQLQGGVILTAGGGTLALAANAGQLNLDGADGSLVTGVATGAGARIELPAVVASGVGPDLTLGSDGTIDLQGTVNLGADNLSLQIDADASGSDAIDIDQNIIAGAVSMAAGGIAGGDTITVSVPLTSVSDDIRFSAVQTADVNANLAVGGDIIATNVGDLQLVGGTSVSATGNIDLDNTVTLVSVSGGGDVTLDQDGAGGVFLPVVNKAGPGGQTNVVISAEGSVALSDVDLNAATDGDLTVNFDTDLADGAETLSLSGPITNVGDVSLSGTGTGDLIDVDASIDAEGAVSLSNADVRIVSGITITGTSPGTAVDLSTNVGTITLDGGPGSLSITAEGGGDINLADLVSATGVSVNAVAQGDITLADVTLTGGTNGNLTVAVDSDNNGTNVFNSTGTISDVGALSFSGNVINDDVINIGQSVTATTITIQNALSVVLDGGVSLSAQAGDIVANSSVGSVDLSGAGTVSLTTGGGGDINLSAVDGSAATADLVLSASGTIELFGTVDVGTNDLSITADHDGDSAEVLGINQALIASTLTIRGDDSVTQPLGTITVANLELLAGASITLDRPGNDIGVLSGAGVGAVVIRDTNELVVGATTVSGLTTSGDVSLQAGTVTLSGVVDAGSADVSIVSAGAIVDDNSATADLIADELILSATTGIGAGVNGPLDVDVAILDVTNAASGAIQISNAGALEIQRVNQGANSRVEVSAGSVTVSTFGVGINNAAGSAVADIVLTANSGDVIVNAPVANNNVGPDATITLTSAGEDADIGVHAPVSSAAGEIVLDAGDAIVLSAPGNLTATGAGQISLLANRVPGGNDGGTIAMSAGVTIDAGSGDVTLEAGGSVTLAEIRTTSAAPGAIAVTSSGGALLDADGTDVNLVAPGGRAVLSAATGIGSADAIETQVAALSALNSGTGSIHVEEVDDLTVFSIVQAANDSVTISADALEVFGAINITAPAVSAAADITLTGREGVAVLASVSNSNLSTGADIVIDAATGATGAADISIQAAVGAAAGNITLRANDSIQIGASGAVVAVGAGLVQIVGDADAAPAGADGAEVISMADGSLVDGDLGDVTLSTTGSIALGSVRASTSNQNNVTIASASGSIVDGGDGSADVVAHGLALFAATGIGDGDALETDVVVYSDIRNTDGGNIDLDQVGASLEIDTVEQVLGGNISISANSIDVTNAGAGIRVLDGANADGVDSITLSGSGLSIRNEISVASDNPGADVTLSATLGADASIDVEALVSTAGGDVTLMANDSIRFTADGQVDAFGGGAVVATADANLVADGAGGDIFRMDDGAAIDSGSGAATVRAAGDVILGRLATTSMSAGAVAVTSTAGAIVDGGNSSLEIDAPGGGVSLVAAGGIGDANPLEVAASTLGAANSNDGDIRVAFSGDAVVDGVSQTLAGSIELSSAGSLTVSGAGVTIGTGALDADINLTAGADLNVDARVSNASTNPDASVTMTATGANSDITVSAAVEATGAVALNSDDSVVMTAAASITSVNGGASVAAGINAAAGDDGDLVLMSDGARIDGGTGDVAVSAGGDVSIAHLVTTSANVTAVTVTSASGAILDAGDTDLDIIAITGGINLVAVLGIGSGASGSLDTRVASLDASNQSSGRIGVTDLDGLSVNAATQTRSGDIELVTLGGDLDIAIAGTGVRILDADGAGDPASVVLDARGGNLNVDQVVLDNHDNAGASVTLLSEANIEVRAPLDVVAGNITLRADGLLSFSVAGDVSAVGSGSVVAAADDDGGNDGIFMADGTVIDAGAGEVSLVAGGRITLGEVITTATTAAAVTVQSTADEIVDGASVTNVVASGGTLVLSAATGIGAAGAIQTEVAALVADNATVGRIAVAEVDELDINRVHQAATGGISISAGGRTEVTAAGSGVVVNGTATLVAVVTLDTVDGDLVVANQVRNNSTDAGSSVVLTAGGALRDMFLGEAGTVVVDAGVVELGADGDITLGEITSNSPSATAILITATQGGVIDVNTGVDVVAPRGTLVVSANAGVGTSDGLETTVAALQITNSSGDIRIDETDDLSILSVTQQLSGSIDLHAGGLLEVAAGAGGVRVVDTGNSDQDVDITLSAIGSITVDDVVSLASDSPDAHLTLAATGSASDVTVNALLATAEGDINVSAADGITLSPAAAVSASGVGSVLFEANADANDIGADSGESVAMADGALVDAGLGDISVIASGDVTLGGLTTASGSVSAISIVTSGSVIDGGDTDVDVAVTSAGGRVSIQAVGGIGAADTIEGRAPAVSLDNNGGGDISYRELGTTLNLVEEIQRETGNINLFADGALTVSDSGNGIRIEDTAGVNPDSGVLLVAAAGDLNVDAPVTLASANSGATVTLEAQGSNSDVVTSAAITLAAGTISVLADDSITVAGDMTAPGAGAVILTADADGVAIGDGGESVTQSGLVDAGSGLIEIDAVGDVIVGSLVTASTSLTAIDISSVAGSILDGGDAATDIVAAGTAVLSAALGVGTGVNGALETTLGRVDVVTVAGDANLAATGDLILGALDVQGDLNVVASGNISDTASETVSVSGSGTFDTGGVVVLVNDLLLDNAGHTLGTLHVSQAADVTIVDQDAIVLGQIDIAGLLLLTAGGAVTQAPATSINAATLEITTISPTSASITLDQDNDTNTVSFATTTDGFTPAPGAIRYSDVNGFLVERVLTSGAAGSAVTLVAGGAVTQQGGAGSALVAETLLLRGGGSYTLENPANDVGVIAGDASGSTAYFDLNDLVVGTVAAVVGLQSQDADISIGSAGGVLTLTESVTPGAGNLLLRTDTGSVVQSGGAVTAQGLELSGGPLSGDFELAQSANNVSLLAADVNGRLTYTDVSGFQVASVGGTSGLRSSNQVSLAAQGNGSIDFVQPVNVVDSNLLLDVTGDLTQSASGIITADGLQAIATGVVSLGEAGNRVANLGATSGGAFIFDSAIEVALTTVGAATGVTAGTDLSVTANGSILVQGPVQSGAALSLGSAQDVRVQAGGSLLATGPGGTVTLNADTDATGVSTLSIDGSVSAASSLVLAGGSDLNDQIDINVSILAGERLTVTDAGVVDLAGDISLSAGDDITVVAGVGTIRLSGSSASTTIIETLVSGDITLANLTDTGATGLTVRSADSLTLLGADLSGFEGAIHLFEIDNASEGSETLLVSDADVFTASTLQFSSGVTGVGDTLRIAADIDAVGPIIIDDFAEVVLDAATDRFIEARQIRILDDIGAITLARIIHK